MDSKEQEEKNKGFQEYKKMLEKKRNFSTPTLLIDCVEKCRKVYLHQEVRNLIPRSSQDSIFSQCYSKCRTKNHEDQRNNVVIYEGQEGQENLDVLFDDQGVFMGLLAEEKDYNDKTKDTEMTCTPGSNGNTQSEEMEKSVMQIIHDDLTVSRLSRERWKLSKEEILRWIAAETSSSLVRHTCYINLSELVTRDFNQAYENSYGNDSVWFR